MTTASALVALNQDIVNARTAITNKGGTVTSGGGSYQLAKDIATIPSGGSSPVITSLSITPTTSLQTITAPSGTDGYSPITVSAVTSSIDSNISAENIKKDVTILNVTGTYEGSGGGDFQLTRVKDDTNTEIGTHYMDFTDGNGNKFKVICLDARYRLATSKWCSNSNSIVTNLPLYDNSYSGFWYDDAKETATFNTQKILDFCSARGYTSTSCSHCRSKSFMINGTTYYGQLPNQKQVFEMWIHRVKIESMDTSASSQTALNFSTSRPIWSSTQYSSANGHSLDTGGGVYRRSKTSNYFACPVLEIPY